MTWSSRSATRRPLGLLAGLWWWRRWGIWLPVGLALVSVLTEILIGMPLIHIVRVPAVTMVLVYFVYRHRCRFTTVALAPGG